MSKQLNDETYTGTGWLLTPHLPYGIINNYPVPHAFVRSGMFTSLRYHGRATRPAFTEQTEIATYCDVHLYQCAGEQLEGNDLDVIGACLNLASRLPVPGPDEASMTVRLEEKGLLKRLGWNQGGQGRNLLERSLERMSKAEFVFDAPSTVESGKRTTKLIHHTSRETEGRGKIVWRKIALSTDLIPLTEAGWTLLNQNERIGLKDNPLAQWLHAFYSSHAKPHPLLPDTIKRLANRGAMPQKKWTATLTEALSVVKKITGWQTCGIHPETGKIVVQKKYQTYTVKQPAIAGSNDVGHHQDIDDDDI